MEIWKELVPKQKEMKHFFKTRTKDNIWKQTPA